MKKIVALFFLLVYSAAAMACSTFLLSKDGRLVFGRNYDWVSGNGIVVVNANGVKKTSFVQPGEKAITWVSQCGSITFNQFGKEFPHGGMNEKGLVVELMWLSETAYPQADDRASMNELQWIQYQLDNFTSVDEVIDSDKNIRISRAGAAPLHFLVADAYGNAATIEFVNGKMEVHRGKDLPNPVLTNTIYEEAYNQVKGGNRSAYGNNSVERFAIACNMVQQFRETDSKEEPVAFAFGILDKIAQGSYTKWRIVYDITNRSIHFVTNGTRKQIALNEFNFSCNRPSLFLDINTTATGGVAKHFVTLDASKNKQVLQQSAFESRSQIQIPDESIQGASAYFEQVQCASK